MTGTNDITDAALFIANDLHRPLKFPDAVHLAIARRIGATLVTADHRQGDAAAALGIGYVDPTRLT